MAEIESLGDFDKIMEALKERLENQDKRHEGGNKNIGTAGKSPFGAYGYNPEGIRIGQKEGRHGKAVKVWDKRNFKNLDGDREIGTRNIKVALRRLRKFAREGAVDELDLDGTIRGTAKKGWLDIQMRPEKRNAVKVLTFFDIGGSMDAHVRQAEDLFSAARSEFKRLEYFYLIMDSLLHPQLIRLYNQMEICVVCPTLGLLLSSVLYYLSKHAHICSYENKNILIF